MDPISLPEEIPATRITLRKHVVALAQTMFEYIDRDRDRLSQFLPWPAHITSVADERKYIEGTLKAWAKGTLFDYGIFRVADGVFMGNIGVHHIVWADDRCEIGYWVLGDFEGQGYVNEAVGALEGALFGVGFNRIEIWCDADNQRSAQLPKRRGYQLEGVLREARLTNRGYTDTLVYGRLRSDWEAADIGG